MKFSSSREAMASTLMGPYEDGKTVPGRPLGRRLLSEVAASRQYGNHPSYDRSERAHCWEGREMDGYVQDEWRQHSQNRTERLDKLPDRSERGTFPVVCHPVALTGRRKDGGIEVVLPLLRTPATRLGLLGGNGGCPRKTR